MAQIFDPQTLQMRSIAATPDRLDASEHYLSHSKIFAKLTFCMLLSGLLLTVLYYDLNFFGETIYAEFTQLNLVAYVLTMIQVSSFIAIVGIVCRRYFLHKYKELARLGGNLFYLSTEFKVMLAEIVVTLMIPFDQFRTITFEAYNNDLQIYTTYSVNDIVFLLMAMRIYLLIELFLRSSEFASFQMQKYLKLAKIDDNLLFIVKSMVTAFPYAFFAFSMGLSLCLFAYLIRVCELPVAVTIPVQTFQSYINAIWMVTITMTTVGYADYTPKTVPGRIICFLMIIWGIYLMSLIIIILFRSLELDNSERQSLGLFNKLELKKELHRVAAKAISECWLVHAKKKSDDKPFFRYLIRFRLLQTQIRMLDSSQSENFYQKLNYYYDNMQASVQELTLLHQRISRFNNSLRKTRHSVLRGSGRHPRPR